MTSYKAQAFPTAAPRVLSCAAAGKVGGNEPLSTPHAREHPAALTVYIIKHNRIKVLQDRPEENTHVRHFELTEFHGACAWIIG